MPFIRFDSFCIFFRASTHMHIDSFEKCSFLLLSSYHVALQQQVSFHTSLSMKTLNEKDCCHSVISVTHQLMEQFVTKYDGFAL